MRNGSTIDNASVDAVNFPTMGIPVDAKVSSCYLHGSLYELMLFQSIDVTKHLYYLDSV